MNCYVVSQKVPYDLPKGLDKDNTIFFPEMSMTFDDMMRSGRPEHFHIVTDSPFLVPLYSRHEVFVWDLGNSSWENPDYQTYGCSYGAIMSGIFNHDYSIPRAVIDGDITNVMGRGILK